jgi:hypothetical protein
MTRSGFAALLAQDLDPGDLQLVLGVFQQDVERLAGVLDGDVARGDAAGFRRTCHALAGAAGAVGAAALEQACRDLMSRSDLSPADLGAARSNIRALGAAALEEMAAFLDDLPRG